MIDVQVFVKCVRYTLKTMGLSMSTVEIPEFYKKLLEQVLHDAILLTTIIVFLLIFLSVLFTWLEWKTYGQRH